MKIEFECFVLRVKKTQAGFFPLSETPAVQ